MPHLKSAVGQEINMNDVVRWLSQHLSESENTVDISIQVVIVSLKCDLVLKYRLKHSQDYSTNATKHVKTVSSFYSFFSIWVQTDYSENLIDRSLIVGQSSGNQPFRSRHQQHPVSKELSSLNNKYHIRHVGVVEKVNICKKNNNKCKWSAWEQILFTITSTPSTLPSCVDMVMSNVGTGVTGEEP